MACPCLAWSLRKGVVLGFCVQGCLGSLGWGVWGFCAGLALEKWRARALPGLTGRVEPQAARCGATVRVSVFLGDCGVLALGWQGRVSAVVGAGPVFLVRSARALPGLCAKVAPLVFGDKGSVGLMGWSSVGCFLVAFFPRGLLLSP